MLLLRNAIKSASIAATLLMAFAVLQPVQAQSLSGSASRSGARGAGDALRAGLKAQKARRHSAAVKQFSRAINSGGLKRKQMSLALYHRAISARLLKRPAQAISDLNSALYVKGALTPTNRAKAIEERAKAYRDAGLLPPRAVASSLTKSQAASWGASTAVSKSGKSKTSRGTARRSAPRLPSTAPILSKKPVKRTSGPRRKSAGSSKRAAKPVVTWGAPSVSRAGDGAGKQARDKGASNPVGTFFAGIFGGDGAASSP